MKPIRSACVLVDYDGAQVFEGRDPSGGRYVGVMIESAPGADRYLVAGVGPERLRLLRAGGLDLRTLFLEAGRGEWLVADSADGLATPIHPQRPDASGIPSEWLPDEGLFLSDGPKGEPASREAGAPTNTDTRSRAPRKPKIRK